MVLAAANNPAAVPPAAGGGDVEIESAVSAKTKPGGPLYADRIRVYPKKVAGRFRRIKWIALIIMLGLYYILPWVRWNRGPGAPDQALLIDLPGRRGYFFFLEIWPQEVYFITGLLILAAVAIFLFTSLMGRVWCGYACPQTVWTDLFMWVERMIEGDRNARIKLDKSPLSAGKAAKKIAKHLAWLLIAAATGGAWIMYFEDAPTVTREFFTLTASSTVYGFFALFTAGTYVLAGWAREQVCTYMCPWPRFQGAMFDEDTLVVTYEAWRGEKRGPHKKGQSWDGRGHCVDCNQCVAVCPTGIDIRDGQQMECIGCALCIDACDTVMDKVGLPRGLIAFNTMSNQMARAAGRPGRWRLWRARTIFYGALLAIVGAVMLWALIARPGFEVHVLRDRSPAYVQLSNGDIRNGYTLRILNKQRRPRTLTLSMIGPGGAAISVVGSDAPGAAQVELEVEADRVASYLIYVRVPRNALTAESVPLTFILTDRNDGERHDYASVYLGPEP